MKPDDKPAGLINWSAALATTGDDEALLNELVTVFMEEAPIVLRDLHAALEQRNSKHFQRFAHTLKGSLRIFGATEAEELAHQLEQLGGQNRLTEVGPLVGQLDACIDQAMSELKQRQQS